MREVSLSQGHFAKRVVGIYEEAGMWRKQAAQPLHRPEPGVRMAPVEGSHAHCESQLERRHAFGQHEILRRRAMECQRPGGYLPG